MGAAGAVGLFVSILLHEFGHAIVARRYGMSMKGITLFIFGGVAEMDHEPPSAKIEFLVAIAGPIVSVLIAAACYGASIASGNLQVLTPATGVLWYLALINAVVVGFNLIPAFPLDGGRMLRSLLWHIKGSLKWATRITTTMGSVFGLILIALGAVNFIGGNFVGGIWQFLIGMFLRAAAQMSYQQVLMRRAFEGEPISRFMRTDVHTIAPETTVSDFVEDYIYKHHHKMYPVTQNGQLSGCVTLADVKRLPRDQWPQHHVDSLVHACSDANTVSPDADAMDVLSKMSRDKISRVMVVDDGQLRGIVSLKDLLEFLSLKVELEEEDGRPQMLRESVPAAPKEQRAQERQPVT